MTVQETLAQLVAIDSVSAKSNSEIVAYLAGRCAAKSFSLREFPYVDERGVDKINLVAIAGTEVSSEPQVELALCGHTDTVPYDPAWLEATTLTERDGKLFGRGACDTKGFIAAALTAVETLDLNKLQRPLALIFTADEEVGLLGAKHLAQLKPMSIRYCIVGEPTSLRPIRAGKGYSLAEVVVRGREAHSAYPALGASAVFRAARLISRIESLSSELQKDQHSTFDPPYTTVNIGLIKGGTAKNVIAGECRFTVEWRPIPSQPSSWFLGQLENAIAAEKSLDPSFDCEIVTGRADSGFETAQNSQLVQLLETSSGFESGSVAFGTEAAQMGLLGSEAVVIGPGDIREAHRTGEFVPINELERCVEILATSIRTLCF